MKIYLICALLLICSSGLYSQEYRLPAGLKYKMPKNSIDITKTYERKTDNGRSVIDLSNDGILYRVDDDIIFRLTAVEKTFEENLLERLRKNALNGKQQLNPEKVITEIQKKGEFSYYRVYKPLLDRSKMQASSYILDNSHSIFVGCVMIFPVNKREKANVIFDKFISSLRYKEQLVP
ncbi:hypothetical protein [Pedobacter sp. JY14-1]|uniref:hypothetical protein n=1 Tax=Pedobacter sp. JY14-1 TaxID=3034151 RepID=UPI0023E26835|nr:hypothetical protein [Pedobacter sp. JY14-1]